MSVLPAHLEADASVAPAAVVGRRPHEASDARYREVLLDGLDEGRFGDCQIRGPAAVALVEILRRRHWPIDLRDFSNAIPHMPERFGLTEMREVLFRLDLYSAAAEQPGRSLAALPPGSMVLGEGGRLLFPVQDDQGATMLSDLSTGERIAVRASRTYRCILVTDCDSYLGKRSRKPQPLLNRIVSGFRPELRLLLFLTFLSGLLVVLASKSVAFVFATVLPAAAIDTLGAVLIGVAGLFVFDIALRRLRAKLIGYVSARIEFILSVEIFEKLMKLPLDMVTAASAGDQVGRLKQFESVRDFFCGPVATIFFEIPLVLLLLGVVTVIDFRIGLLVAGSILAFATVGATLLPRLRSATADLSAERSEYARRLAEALDHAPEILRRGLGRAIANRLQPLYERVAEAQFAVDHAYQRMADIAAALGPVTMAGAIFLGARDVIAGESGPGTFVVCVLLTTRLLGPVQQTLLSVARLPEVMGVLGQIDAMMRIDTGTDRAGALAPNRAQIRRKRPPLHVEGVVLRYPRSVNPALKGVSATIAYGGLTCLCGPSGAGKTSLLRSIAGLVRLQAGGVFLDGRNLEQFGMRQRSDLIGYMGHAPLVIHGTVFQNLRLTAPGAPVVRLEEICDELGLLSQIEDLPEGFDTRLSREMQSLLTPAFRTKLAVAQLLLRDPVVLLLDSPEAGLSPADEASLMAAIARRRAEMSCVLVTHRPSILNRADHVLALDTGRIVFSGKPADLNRERPR